MKNYYDILGVSKNASEEEIKRRYHFLAKALHPDRFMDKDSKAEALSEMQKINEAYSHLSMFFGKKENENPLKKNFIESLDITPIPLGIEDQNGYFLIIFNENTFIPCKTEILIETQNDDNDTSVINLYQGYHRIARLNNHLCSVQISTKDVSDKNFIKLIVDIDPYGILHIEAFDCNSNHSLRIIKTVTGSGLSESQIESIKKSSFEFR